MLASASKCASNVLIFNCSPRMANNTMALPKEVKRGVESVGKTAEIVHLNKLKFKSCQACLQCKKPNAPASCVIRDDLTKYIDQLHSTDAIAIGTPIYFGNFTANFYAFFERMMYCNYNYDANNWGKPQKKINSALVLTGGAEKTYFDQRYLPEFEHNKEYIERILKGKCEILVNASQLLAKDTSKY